MEEQPLEFTVSLNAEDTYARQLLLELAKQARVTAQVRDPGVTLVLGGARSGKSVWAEQQLLDQRVEYVATSYRDPEDSEWERRVAIHQARRPAHWSTTESIDLAEILLKDSADPVLVDCLAVWLDRLLLESGAWEDRAGWRDELTRQTASLVAAIKISKRDVILVSNEVGQGIVPATASGRLYRDELGRLNAAVAAACGQVWFCTAGIARRIK